MGDDGDSELRWEMKDGGKMGYDWVLSIFF
jgi:hypothetical protein